MTANSDPGYGQDWYVSHWNIRDPKVAELLGKTIIHDTTLRDGEQHAGIAFSAKEKVEIGTLLAEIGVHRVEVCTPMGGEEEQRAARELAAAGTDAEIWVLIRALRADAELAVSLGVDATAIACLANDQYLSAFRWTLDQILDLVGETVEHVQNGGLAAGVCIADASRMSRRRLEEIISGIDRRCRPGSYMLMDTFGALEPEGTAKLVTFSNEMTEADIEFHGHNDFGLSVANSLAAAAAGATAIHTAVNGLGERIGNTPMEEYIVAANVLYEAKIPVDTTRLVELSRVVATASGLQPASNKPIVGQFNRIESGLVATEYSRMVLDAGLPAQWMMPFTPGYVGQDPIEIVVGKASGATNVRHVLATTKYAGLSDDSVRDLLQRVHERSVEVKRVIDVDELVAMAEGLAPR